MLFGLSELLIVDQLEFACDLAETQPLTLRRLYLETMARGFAGQVAQLDGHLSKQPILGVHDDPYAVLVGW
jgi:hypothetical protein